MNPRARGRFEVRAATTKARLRVDMRPPFESPIPATTRSISVALTLPTPAPELTASSAQNMCSSAANPLSTPRPDPR
ncbi:hypothetical protein DB30_03356 [Enhygromyxa salina]|uniref:Uncharacterized protein n=1 Tax=Enhygromyxa salina TaxID=215803 RepID=A0A0C2DCJ4_9BACT|nr:hypothetical protein DB30_03356 [Enhygromyxa salina]